MEFWYVMSLIRSWARREALDAYKEPVALPAGEEGLSSWTSTSLGATFVRLIGNIVSMATPTKRLVIAFDLYGTLLSTESIGKEVAELVGSEEKGARIAVTWRKYQLEYSWRLNSMGMVAATSKRFKFTMCRAI
jgi:hypothetical protein